MSIPRIATLVAATLLPCHHALAADEADQPLLSLAGFGTVGATHSNDKTSDFTSAYYHPNGPGHSREWSADIDTVLALQTTVHMTSKLSAVLQVVVNRGWRNAYRPTVEWANVQYAFTPDFSVRLGRTLLPTFLDSDSRKVGYTNPWVRPPLETYTIYEFTNSDGVDASYRFHLGQATHTLTAIYGGNHVISPDGTPEGYSTKIRDSLGLIDRIEYGPWTFQIANERAVAFQPKLAADPDPAIQAFASFHFTVRAFGFRYDPGRWFITGEKATISTRGDQQSGWHIGGGYRLGAFTPYVIYAKREPLTGPDAAGPGQDTTAQSTTSIGLRWDFRKNADIKLQFDRIRNAADSSGLFINLQPDFRYGGQANLVSIVMDFVF